MKRQILILSLLFIIIGCKKNEKSTVEDINNSGSENRFESKVFSFNYPEDWNITDSEEIEEGIYYVAIEKNGFDSSGLMTIVSFEELVDLDESINFNIEELQNNPMVSNLNFESIMDNKFNDNESRSSSFNFKTLGIKHEGYIFAFSNDNNSIVILIQEAIEDKNKNVDGFKTIETSFELK